MRLNSLQPADGAKRTRKRVGRGIGSGHGKTAGRGHKGQKSRSGSPLLRGFEGGQMPYHRRIPKSGFSSYRARITAQIRLSDLQKMKDESITLASLRAANIINANIKAVKIFASGKLEKAVRVIGLRVSKGAKAAIEAAGGKVEEANG